MNCKVLIASISILSLGLISCSASDSVNQDKDKVLVAKAGNEVLNIEDYNTGFFSTPIVDDSLYYSKKSIENWAIESLFYQEALSKLLEEEIDIDKQVENYKKSLVNYIYQTKMVEANLDTVILYEEIKSYYNEHRDNFILRDNIVVVNYLKVPLLAQGLPKIKRLVWSTDSKDKEQLLTLCSQNAENFFMNDSVWLFLEEVKKEIPALKEQPDYSISKGRVFEYSDDQYYYYLKVKDVKVKNSYSPINFESQNIKKFILNNRKTQLIKQYKQMLLENAEADKTFVIY